MATCKECLYIDECSGFTPSDLDRDVFDYCRKGITEEIPDIEKRCSSFKPAADVVSKRDYEALLHKYELSVAEREANVKGFSEMLHKQRIDLAKEIFEEISKISVPSLLPTVKMDWGAFMELKTRYTMEEL